MKNSSWKWIRFNQAENSVSVTMPLFSRRFLIDSIIYLIHAILSVDCFPFPFPSPFLCSLEAFVLDIRLHVIDLLNGSFIFPTPTSEFWTYRGEVKLGTPNDVIDPERVYFVTSLTTTTTTTMIIRLWKGPKKNLFHVFSLPLSFRNILICKNSVSQDSLPHPLFLESFSLYWIISLVLCIIFRIVLVISCNYVISRTECLSPPSDFCILTKIPSSYLLKFIWDT